MSARWFVPGRIEVFGKHTDYGGGRSLVAATSQGLTVTAEPAADVHVEAPGAAAYLETVLAGLRSHFGPAPGGARLRVEATLPVAAGLSSSSALVTGLVLALSDLWGHALPDGEGLVDFIAEIERGIGVRGGAEDHAAILLGQPDRLLQCRFRPARCERTVAWPEDHCFVVAVSGVVAEKALGARERYNRTAGVLHGAEERGIDLAALIDDPGALDSVEGLDLATMRRLRQFVTESAGLVPAAADAVAAGDWKVFADCARQSHVLAREALGNAVPETEALTEAAWRLGAVAASPFGAGFGGSVWAVVSTGSAENVAARWHTHTLITRPSRGAHRLEE